MFMMIPSKVDDDPPVSHCSSGLLGGELPFHQSHTWSVKWLRMDNYHFLDWSSMMIMKNVQECLQCLSRLTAFYIFHLTLLWSSSLLRSLFIFIHNFTHFAVGVFLAVVNIFFFVVFVVINLPLLLSWGLLPKYFLTFTFTSFLLRCSHYHPIPKCEPFLSHWC